MHVRDNLLSEDYLNELSALLLALRRIYQEAKSLLILISQLPAEGCLMSLPDASLVRLAKLRPPGQTWKKLINLHKQIFSIQNIPGRA